MTELLTAAQMRAIEQAAIGAGEVTGLELMERAGSGVVEAILAEWPELAKGPGSAVVLCGPGNNGGDGFVIARLLAVRGWQVEVFLYGDPARLPADARVNYRRLRETNVVQPLHALNDAVHALHGRRYDIVVDALFGTGLSRALPDAACEVLCGLFRSDLDGAVVAVDVPSGLCADSGRALVPAGWPAKNGQALGGLIAEAQLTVTFHSPKLGHVLDAGPRHCGKLVVKDIGLRHMHDPEVVHTSGANTGGLAKRPTANKFDHGHALVLSGPSGRGGASRLAARGALRIGAGLVTLGTPPEAMIENAARLDAVMLRAIADADALAAILADRRINALCLGPGLGTHAREAALVGAALQARRMTVLDADALTLLAGDLPLFGLLHPQCVLTPHGGEFARLFPDIAARLAAPATTGPAYSKVDAAREAAARAGCVVLCKGADTVIAAPDGRCAVNAAAYDRAAPWLATAGSGDVLAGFITGLLARGFDPYDAACTGAWLHVEAARSLGPGLIAEDLPEELPRVFRALGL